jgi:protein-S-isoprenylcysteine O-methyltransferase Ste14
MFTNGAACIIVNRGVPDYVTTVLRKINAPLRRGHSQPGHWADPASALSRRVHCGWMLFTYASFWNPFFQTTVRIQAESGHRVMDKGPYALVRHPGYVGLLTPFLVTPLLIPSLWIAVVTELIVVLVVIRTALEDRMMQLELPGYAEYAEKVRFRLIPGLW